MEYIGIIQRNGINHSLTQELRQKGYLSQVLPFPLSAAIKADKFLKGIIISSSPGESSLSQKELIEAGFTRETPVVAYDPTDEGETLDEILPLFSMDPNWNMEIFASKIKKELSDTLQNSKVFCALSGGVDSTVVATILHEIVGENLHCVFVDTGLMRHQEREEVTHMFTKTLELPLVVVDAGDRFLSLLQGVSDPEAKRKIIGETFIRIFEEESQKVPNPDNLPLILAQGTIYPDVIESGVGGDLVKSHHNVGGLPDDIDFQEIVEPVRDLFKYEVRDLGRLLGIPESFISRQPFPGPGLALRVLGEVTREKLEIARQANYIFETEIKQAGLDIWQYFAVLTDIFSVGMVNGKRTYGNTIALRAVSSQDAMEASFYPLPYELLGEVSRRLTSEIKGITRVVYDITPKPPATIEWE